MHFNQTDGYGRIVHLQPVQWRDDWPVIGEPIPGSVAGQPVVLTANAPVWLQVSEKGGATLFSGMLQPGQTYDVPTTATAPVLKTGKPEALQVRVGNQVAPPVGPAATTVNNVSLLAADLMKPGAAPAAASTATAAPAPQRAVQQPRQAAPAAVAPSAEPVPAEANPLPTTNAQ